MSTLKSERITSLVPDPANPRRMTDEATAGLARSMERFGALDIVFNRRTKQLVSGHQRVAALKAAGAKTIQRNGDWGFILHPKTKERFPVRYVDWTPEEQRIANITANNTNIMGAFEPLVLEQLDALKLDADFGTLQGESLIQGLTVEFAAMKGGEIDENLLESFGGAIGKNLKTFAVTLDVPKKHEALFADLPKDEAIEVLVKWLKGARKA
jgi:hypothetical protein